MTSQLCRVAPAKLGRSGALPRLEHFMLPTDSAVALFDQHTQAEEAVKYLKDAQFDIRELSIIGKDYHTDEHVAGYYTTGDRMKYWGKNGAFWGGMWGLLFGSAFFVIPGVGTLLAAGPIVAMIVGALEGAAVVGGASVLGAGLFSLGIPKNSVLEYETALKAGKFMLIVHGTSDEIARAKGILATAGASKTALHAERVPASILA